jgi:hypothetical protein
MKPKRKFLFFFATLMSTTTACSDRHASGHDLVQKDALGTDRANREWSGERKTVCYRSEWNDSDAESLPDVLELTVTIDGRHVEGIYNWLPAYKDQRLGNFNGDIEDGHITASYEFRQEGVVEQALVSIDLQDNQAVVSGGREESGLDATIGRVACQ